MAAIEKWMEQNRLRPQRNESNSLVLATKTVELRPIPLKKVNQRVDPVRGVGGGEGGSTTTNSTKTKKKSKQWPLKRKPPSGNTKESETRQHHQ